MTAPGGVLGKHHVARPETSDRAFASFDLDLPGQVNDVLAFGHVMKITSMTGRRTAKLNPVRRLQFRCLETSERVQLDFYVFEMRFVIGAGVKSDDLHEPVCKRIGWEMQGVVNRRR